MKQQLICMHIKKKFIRALTFTFAFLLSGYTYLETNLQDHLLLSLFDTQVLDSRDEDAQRVLQNYYHLKSLAEAEKQASRIEVLKINPDMHNKLKVATNSSAPEYLYLQLFSDLNLELRKKKIILHKNGLITFVGKVQSDPYSRAVLTFHENGVVGSLILDGFEYKIKDLGSGLHLIARLNSRYLNNVDPDYVEAPPAPAQDLNKQSDTFSDGTFVDVLAVYSADAIATDPSIVATITNIIDETNQSLASSCINFRLRLVHTEQIAYAETLQGSQVLECLSEESDGCMDNVHSLRDAHGADIVSFWQANPIAIAYLAPLGESNPVAGFNANSVYGAIVTSAAFRHEFGHNMGIQHDRYSDDKSNYKYSESYKSAFAYVDIANNFSTNVARGASCYYADLGCEATAHYSNPRILRYGHPMGIPGIADAAAIANTQAKYLADYRQANSDYEPDLSGCEMKAENSKVLPQCFISTAAYGSYLSPYTEKLRLFRDQALNTNGLGRFFVKTYYKLSPPLAEIISASQFLKVLTKILLTPVVWFLVSPGMAFLSLIFWSFIIALPYRKIVKALKL